MKCTLCPRKCGADREKGLGACGVGDKIRVAKIMLHHWEEPSISGTRGSGAIFFSGCPLKCVYCQNREISHGGHGEEITVAQLAEAMLSLQAQGAHNINLVSPTQYSDKIKQAIDLIRDELEIPVVYNTGGYEDAEQIAGLRGYVDIFLTDIKYFSSEASKKYSSARDYFEMASHALDEMLKIAPECVFDEHGIMRGGVIIRHLVLPTLRADSIRVLETVAERIDISKIRLSLMSQYTPDFCDEHYRELKRKITTFEYQSVVDKATRLGYEGYIQEKSSASAKYTPEFRREENED
ncbi:MAG: radical SAM protein [Clostridia bacterium]|nr:radical SAM protein [Clostridia bacterium]